jgi:hypothetical protein
MATDTGRMLPWPRDGVRLWPPRFFVGDASRRSRAPSSVTLVPALAPPGGAETLVGVEAGALPRCDVGGDGAGENVCAGRGGGRGAGTPTRPGGNGMSCGAAARIERASVRGETSAVSNEDDGDKLVDDATPPHSARSRSDGTATGARGVVVIVGFVGAPPPADSDDASAEDDVPLAAVAVAASLPYAPEPLLRLRRWPRARLAASEGVRS